MNVAVKECRVTILVKALPRPSRGHSETVCCAGITPDHTWKRLYPIRYRHAEEDFKRWDSVHFQYVASRQDKRIESCRVVQGTLRKEGVCRPADKRALVEPLITRSTDEASQLGRSLTAIRPSDIRFKFRRKPDKIIQQEKDAYIDAARQANMLDREVRPFDPTPFMLSFAFQDEEGARHTNQCGDWETHATFWKWRQSYGETGALDRLKQKYEEEYASKGVVFVMGTLAKRPKQWTLLGIARLDQGPYQTSLL